MVNTDSLFSSGAQKKDAGGVQEQFSIQTKTIMSLTQRIKDIESRLDLSNEKLELVDHNAVKNFKRVFNDEKQMRDELRDIKQELESIKEFQKKVSKQFKLMSTVDEVKKLEKYIDLWDPMNFVSKEELEESHKKVLDELRTIIEEYLK